MTRREKTDLKILGTLAIITLIGILVLCTGCNPDSGKPESNTLDSTSNNYSKNYRIYTLDGCEYVVVGISDYQWGGHKGDCKNPIHEHNDVTPIDTTEKHFDCTVEAVESGDDKNRYMYTTECGLTFYSNQKYKVGQTLKNFESPKHK